MAWPAAAGPLRGRKLQVVAQIELPRGDALIDVAADAVDFACPRIDMRDHFAMGAPDRARVRAALELRPDALAHDVIAGVGERGFALIADQIAHVRSGRGERTGAIN